MNVSRRFAIAWIILASIALNSCATGTSATVRGGGPSMAQARAERYDGPKARLAVVKFMNKSAKGAGLGTGLADMLTAELFRTNRFIMLDRQDLDAVINEQDFAASGRISDKTAATIGQIEGADLLVFGAITAFEPDHIGVGGFIMGAITLGASIAIASHNEDAPIGAVTYTESYIAADIKIVDAATGRVLSMSAVEGRYQNWGGGVIGGIGGGSSRVPIWLGGFVGTVAEQAVRVCVEKAVQDIVKNTPAEYYRVKDTMDLTPAGLLAPFYPVIFHDAKPVNIKNQETRVIDNQESYEKLLTDISIALPGAPVYDWEKIRLVALFAGEKQVKGYHVGVIKAIHRDDFLEVSARMTSPPDMKTAEAGLDWPLEIVRIENPGKPVKVVWVD